MESKQSIQLINILTIDEIEKEIERFLSLNFVTLDGL